MKIEIKIYDDDKLVYLDTAESFEMAEMSLGQAERVLLNKKVKEEIGAEENL